MPPLEQTPAQIFSLTLTDMANGGLALGRDANERVIFVPQAIPGERVLVSLVEDKKRYGRARLVEVLETSPERVTPQCPHFGPCGGCQFQHIAYPAQLRYKEAVVRDQLERIGGLSQAEVRPVIANPQPWAYGIEVNFQITDDGRIGFWSPEQGDIMPIETCLIIRPALLELFQDIDLQLFELRQLTLRVGDGDSLLAALEVEGLEAPSLETDFPISVAILLLDNTAANLIGDNYLVQTIKGRDFRVSAGSFFYPSPPATESLVDVVCDYARLSGQETVLELYTGVGTLTAFMAPVAAELIGIELNPDTVADAAVNLEAQENVSLYEGPVEEILPLLNIDAEVWVVDPPPEGLLPSVIDQVAHHRPARLVYVSSDVATLARDGRRLAQAGYRLVEVQPIDMAPQTYHVLTVSQWQADGGQ
ncbi:MAG: class I SAM-dependent RNA methyltransferase [Candidatus Promineifilaceae bacterium]